MRKLFALALAFATISLGMQGMHAQTYRVSSIAGQAVDASGRGIPAQRVELVQNGTVLTSAVTGSQGDYTFANVTPGDYVVRTWVHGTVAGTRVTVARGESANALIVLPSSAAASPAFMSSLGLLGGTLVAAGVAAAVVGTVVAVTGS